jgi:hypothetical protein
VENGATGLEQEVGLVLVLLVQNNSPEGLVEKENRFSLIMLWNR